MPTIPLHPLYPSRTTIYAGADSIPSLLRTPLGLAIMEIQGHINLPSQSSEQGQSSTHVGRLVFPDYNASASDDLEGPWMKKVYFYVGHQRMLGQVKKLPKPFGIIGRKGVLATRDDEMDIDKNEEELEVLEIVKWKIVFNSRPEPVGDEEED